METIFDPKPLVLTDRYVRLEPLDESHAEDLFEAGQDDEIWLYMPRPRPRNVEEVREMIREARRDVENGTSVAFAIVHQAAGRAVGSTRYLDIQRENRSLEIGWTWLGKDQQRTPVNTESKRLLLSHAFDELGAVRVQLKTDERNVRSQRAIERLGAVREGVLRRQRLVWDGMYRNTVYFSILDTEWPAVKQRLETMLAVQEGG